MLIKTNVLYRLSKVCKNFEPNVPEDVKEKLNVIRIEIHQGKGYAIVTNQQIACVEFLGMMNESDKVFHIKLTEKLLRQLETEMFFDSTANIEVISEFAMGNFKTDYGYKDDECFAWLFDTPLNNWRLWLDNKALTSNTAMKWDLYHILSLFESSSGKIAFAEIIDINKPLILRDVENPNWLGFFIPTDFKNYEPARLPEWL